MLNTPFRIPNVFASMHRKGFNLHVFFKLMYTHKYLTQWMFITICSISFEGGSKNIGWGKKIKTLFIAIIGVNGVNYTW